jgi:putative phage-type endonuclease
MKKLNIEQGSKEWLALRKTKIGASDAPVLMQVSPWKTPYQLWLDKMGLAETEKNEAMRRGLDLEPIARQKFIEEIGHEVFPIVALHDSISYMLSSFDGISSDEKIAVEIKCPGYEDHEKAMDGVVPEKYMPQLQHQLEISGLQSMFYFSYTEKTYKILEIERNDTYIKDMIREEQKFWDCMQNLEAPDLIDRDYIQRNDEEWNQLAKEWIELSNLEEKKEKVRKRLLEISGNSNSMGAGIRLSKFMRKGNVDYKAIPNLIGVDLDKYRKGTIETYRIGVC